MLEKREDMNLYKQISKLNPYLRSVDSMTSKEKYLHLKGIIGLNFELSQSDLKEIVAVNSARAKDMTVSDVKVLKGSRHKMVLVLNSFGFVYLLNSRTEAIVFLNEVVFGRDARLENFEKFDMKETHLLMLPVYGVKETFTACNLSEDVLGKITVLLASSKKKLYLLRYDVETGDIVFSKETECPIIKGIECGPNPYTWICSTKNSVVTLTVSAEDGLDIKEELGFKDVQIISKVRCFDDEIYFWQLGSLYVLKDGQTTLVHQSDRKILDIFIIQNTLLIAYVDANLIIMQSTSLDDRWVYKQTTKLAMVGLLGIAVSVNDCALLAIGQKTLFEESAELSVYNLKDLCAQAASPFDQIEQHADVIDLLTWSLRTFAMQRGNYSDIIAMLVALNKLEPVRALVEQALGKEDKSKQSAENVAGFMAEIQSRLKFESQLDAKLLMSRFCLILQSTSEHKSLKATIIISSLKLAKADPSLIKSLKDGAPFECPQCGKKELSVNLSTMTGSCRSCNKTAGLTVSHGTIQHVPDLQLLCSHCGVFHHLQAHRCLLCTQRLERLTDLATSC